MKIHCIVPLNHSLETPSRLGIMLQLQGPGFGDFGALKKTDMAHHREKRPHHNPRLCLDRRKADAAGIP